MKKDPINLTVVSWWERKTGFERGRFEKRAHRNRAERWLRGAVGGGTREVGDQLKGESVLAS